MITKLRSKVRKENIPIFEFRKDVGSILSKSTDLFVELPALELIFNDYMILLREYYLELFTNKCKVASPQDMDSIKESILLDCKR